MSKLFLNFALGVALDGEDHFPLRNCQALLCHHFQLVRFHLLNFRTQEVLSSSLTSAFQRYLDFAVVKRLTRTSCVTLFRANVPTCWPDFLAFLLADLVFIRDALSVVADFRTNVTTGERFTTRSSTGDYVQVTGDISTDFLSTVASFFC